MEQLETGKDKIKEICAILKQEALEPAQKEANKIIEAAEQESYRIIREAEAKAAVLLSQAKEKIEQEKKIFANGLKLMCRQALEALRQDIESKLFTSSLSDWVEEQSTDPTVGAQLITALVHAIEKEGISAHFSALIPASVPAEKVNRILAKNILDKLREKSLVVGEFFGGVQLKLHDRKLTLDLSDSALKELLGQYIRKDFRELLFQA